MKAYFETTQCLLQANTRDEIVAVIKDVCDRFGLDNYLYYRLVSIDSCQPNRAVLNGYPPDWAERYLQQNYITIDPVAAHCFNNTLPLLWHDLQLSDPHHDNARRFMAESREFGLNAGATIPFHGASGDISGLSFTSTKELSRALPRIKRALPFLQALIPYIHEAVNRVEAFYDVKPLMIELSVRETECLRWAAEGKTSWETSMILGISDRTVIFHLQNAVKKLRCANRTQAVARAISLKLLFPAF